MGKTLGLIALVAATGPRLASADRSRGVDLAGWYGKLGAETGVAFARARGTAPLLGVVGTLVHLNDDLEWVGLQGDLVADGIGDRAARWSFGPEAGVFVYGVDLGYFGERVDGDTHHGMQVRAKLTIGVASLYVRGAYALVGADEASLDLGLQLKAPVWIRRHAQRPRIVAQRSAARR